MARRKVRKASPSSQGKAGISRELRRVRNQYGPHAEAEKRRLLLLAAADPPHTAHALGHLHEDLLFMRAFPGEAATLKLVKRLLGDVSAWVRALPREERARLHDTGVAGSVTRHAFPFALVKWLTRRAPGEAEIDWRHYENPTQLDRALFRVMRTAELEAAESGEYSTRAIFKAARAEGSPSDLDWIVDALSSKEFGSALVEADWNDAEMPVAWDLSSSRFATTRNMLAGAPVIMRKAMRRPPSDVAARIVEPAAVELLPRSKARKVIELAQSSLASRCREVVAITHPNPDEVYWCDLGEGAALAVIGVAPDKRLNLETNTGYLLVSNGVPIGYGGVTPFFRQANTGINIFDPFRGSEAAYLWVEMLRAFHAIYGVRRFVVNGYQFGEGNSEAINSGAYWFYYRLGFRPADADQRRLAEREARRLARKGAAPSAKSTLRALARGDLHLDTPGYDVRDGLDEKLLVRASLAASRKLAALRLNDRADAEAAAMRAAMDMLSVASTDGWPREELRAFARLAPIALAARGVKDWAADEKMKILRMLRAKGRILERDFALASSECERFYRALAVAAPP